MEMVSKFIEGMLISGRKLVYVGFFSALYVVLDFLSFSVSLNKAETDCWLENLCLRKLLFGVRKRRAPLL